MASLSSWCDSPFVDRQVEIFSGSQHSFFPNKTGINIYVNQVIVSAILLKNGNLCELDNQTFGGSDMLTLLYQSVLCKNSG